MSETSSTDAAAPTGGPADAKRPGLRRFVPLAVIVAGFVAFFAFGLHEYFTEDALRTHHAALKEWTEHHYALSVLIFIAAYTVVVALSLPVALLFTPVSGFLFGTLLGGGYSLVAATLGATAIFLAARYACADTIRAKAGPMIRRMEDGFREDALSYLLVLRLVPLFPFWLVNLVPAILGVKLSTYLIGTFLGMIPGALVFASVGNGLGAVFEAGAAIDFAIIFKPDILIPLIGLSLLSLVPVAYKKWKARP